MEAEFCALSQPLATLVKGSFDSSLVLCIGVTSYPHRQDLLCAVFQVIHCTREPGEEHKWGLKFSSHSTCTICPGFKLYLPKKGTFCQFSERHSPLTKLFTCRARSPLNVRGWGEWELLLLIHTKLLHELAAALLMKHFSGPSKTCYTISLLKVLLASGRQLADLRNSYY